MAAHAQENKFDFHKLKSSIQVVTVITITMAILNINLLNLK